MNECDKMAERLSGYVDNELTQQDIQLVELHLSRCESCRRSVEQLREMQQAVGRFHYPEPSEDELARIMGDRPAAKARILGWVLVVATAVLLAAVGAYRVIEDDTIAWYVKLLLAVLSCGGVLLLGSVLRQRLLARKSDKYRRVNL